MLLSALLLCAIVCIVTQLAESKEDEGQQDEDIMGSVVAVPTDILEALAKWTDHISNKGSKEKWPDMIRAIEVWFL